MNTLTATSAATSVNERAARFGRHLQAALHQRLMRHRTAVCLQALDDRVLKDIGLTRDQIPVAFFGVAAEARRSPHW